MSAHERLVICMIHTQTSSIYCKGFLQSSTRPETDNYGTKKKKTNKNNFNDNEHEVLLSEVEARKGVLKSYI